jgi:hypothetical protein
MLSFLLMHSSFPFITVLRKSLCCVLAVFFVLLGLRVCWLWRMWVYIFHQIWKCAGLCLVLFCDTGVWTQGFGLARQALCHLSYVPGPSAVFSVPLLSPSLWTPVTYAWGFPKLPPAHWCSFHGFLFLCVFLGCMVSIAIKFILFTSTLSPSRVFFYFRHYNFLITRISVFSKKYLRN